MNWRTHVLLQLHACRLAACSIMLAACFGDAPDVHDGASTGSTAAATSSVMTDASTTEAASTGAPGTATTDADSTSDGSSTAATSTGTSALGALYFDGADEATSQPTALATLPETFTVELWLNLTEAPWYGVIIDARTKPEKGWALDIGTPMSSYAGQISLGWETGSLRGPSVDALDAGWHHVAFTRDADGLAQCWLDGEMTAVAESTAAPLPQVTEISIGRYKFGDPATDYWLRGAAVDDVHVSSAARYTRPFMPGDAVADGSSVLLWGFDEGEGDVAIDQVAGVELGVVGAEWVAGR